MTIEEIRKANLGRIIEMVGNKTTLANKLQLKSISYLSQIMSGDIVMGSRFARKLEEVLGLEKGWMDRDQVLDDLVSSNDTATPLDQIDRKKAFADLLQEFNIEDQDSILELMELIRKRREIENRIRDLGEKYKK